LDFAILGLLHESPMHGYALRKQLAAKLGMIRAAISYGSLYPALRRLQSAGFITESRPDSDDASSHDQSSHGVGKRARIIYTITAEGKERFQELLAEAGPEAFNDAAFDVRFAFFARTDRQIRLRILEGRRRRVEERRESLRQMLGRSSEWLDAYTQELQRHGLEACNREARWLEDLITAERAGLTPGQTSSESRSVESGNFEK